MIMKKSLKSRDNTEKTLYNYLFEMNKNSLIAIIVIMASLIAITCIIAPHLDNMWDKTTTTFYVWTEK